MNEEDFYKDIIVERNKFSQFIKKYLNKYIEDSILIPIYNFIKNDPYTVIWIGGSQSWEKFFLCNSTIIDLNILEKSSITAGNFDIFILTNNKERYDIVVCKLYDLIESFIIQFENFIISKEFTLSRKSDFLPTICNPNSDIKSKQNCVLFPCQAYQLLIKSRKIKTHNYLKLSSPKILIYFESYYIENVNISEFKKLIYTYCENTRLDMFIPYINANGLLILLEFINQQRFNKGLNVDIYRKNLLLNFVKKYFKLNDLYFNILNYYISIFKDTKEYNKFIVHEFIKNIFIYNDTSHHIQSNIETEIVNITRPYINKFIYLFNKETNEKFKNSFLMLVGGDSIKRYSKNIITTDFDTKYYIPLGIFRSNKDNINKFIIDKMCFLTSYFIINKSFLLPNGILEHTYINNDINIKVQYSLIDDNSMQFRLRNLEKTSNCSINLYSIDYRTTVNTIITNNLNQQITYQFFIDVPIFDLVIVPFSSKTDTSTFVNYNTGNNLPIASVDFLIDDITKIYNNTDNAFYRFWNNKNKKDSSRLDLLKNVKENNIVNDNSDINYMFEFKDNLLDVNHLSGIYNISFNNIKLYNNKHNIKKHKIDFTDKSIISDISDNMYIDEEYDNECIYESNYETNYEPNDNSDMNID